MVAPLGFCTAPHQTVGDGHSLDSAVLAVILTCKHWCNAQSTCLVTVPIPHQVYIARIVLPLPENSFLSPVQPVRTKTDICIAMTTFRGRKIFCNCDRHEAFPDRGRPSTCGKRNAFWKQTGLDIAIPLFRRRKTFRMSSDVISIKSFQTVRTLDL